MLLSIFPIRLFSWTYPWVQSCRVESSQRGTSLLAALLQWSARFCFILAVISRTISWSTKAAFKTPSCLWGLESITIMARWLVDLDNLLRNQGWFLEFIRFKWFFSGLIDISSIFFLFVIWELRAPSASLCS